MLYFPFCPAATIQRRLKKEKKAKRRLQEALEYESKRRGQIEQALQQATSSDPLKHGKTHTNTHSSVSFRLIHFQRFGHLSLSVNTDPVSLDMETEHCRSPEDNCTLQGTDVFTIIVFITKMPLLYVNKFIIDNESGNFQSLKPSLHDRI